MYGATGIGGWGFIVTGEDAGEIHPFDPVTVKVQVPGDIACKVIPEPLPVIIIPSGFLVSVQVPVVGNPLSVTLPEDITHVGWVIAIMIGAEGAPGPVLIVTPVEEGDEQPSEFITVKKYVPGGTEEMVAELPVPGCLTLSGERTTVHEPGDGNPERITVPVGTAQVGCVIVPITGADGLGGGELMVTLSEEREVQLFPAVTVNE